MFCPDHVALEPPPQPGERTIHFPCGLFGFDRVIQYRLVTFPNDYPFRWLEMVEDPARSFLVVAPEDVVGRYQPAISREDAAFLEITEIGQALLLVMVTPQAGGGRITINLKSPVVINLKTWIGKQIIPRNVSTFTSQYPVEVGPP